MNSKIYRCGWCGSPTEANGYELDGEPRGKAINIIETYGDYRTHQTNGSCCPPEHENTQRVTRDMAIDAGDLSLEGTLI